MIASMIKYGVKTELKLPAGIWVSKTKLDAADIKRSDVPKPRLKIDSDEYGRCNGSTPNRNPAAATRNKPELGAMD